MARVGGWVLGKPGVPEVPCLGSECHLLPSLSAVGLLGKDVNVLSLKGLYSPLTTFPRLSQSTGPPRTSLLA